MNVYLPDDLAARVRKELGDVNISALVQAALRAELDRRARVTAQFADLLRPYADFQDYQDQLTERRQ